MAGAGVPPAYSALLIGGLVMGRGIDRGNATLSVIKSDFRRPGLARFDLSHPDPRWVQGDKTRFDELLRLRNALAHGNQRELEALRTTGVRDTVSWARRRLPVLNRVARAMDELVWDHLRKVLGTDPWR